MTTTTDVVLDEAAAIEIRSVAGRLAVFAAEGATSARAVVAAMRDSLQHLARIDDLAAAWRAGAAAAGSDVLSVALGVVTATSAAFIHAGDLAVYAVGDVPRRIVEPHLRLSEHAPLRVRTRAIGLPADASRAELTEVKLDRARSIVVATAGVWVPLGDTLLECLDRHVTARELIDRAAAIKSPMADAVRRVPRACAINVVPSASAVTEPVAVAVAAQAAARRAIRSILNRTLGARAALLVGPRGVGKTTVLSQLGRAGMVDQSARMYSSSQLRRELKSGPVTGLCVVDRLTDALGEDAALGATLCEALERRHMSVVASATREELASLTLEHKRLASQLAVIELAPPSTDELQQIVKAWTPRFAERHHVTITPESVSAAVELTSRFALGRSQPEAALFALEHACLRAGHAGVVTGTLDGRGGGSVERDAVRAAIADLQGVSIDVVDSDDRARADALGERLGARLHGQQRAAAQVANAVIRGVERRARARGASQPLASCLLLGPTGTGKTETARLLAEWWFSDRRALTTIDLSEYHEPSSVYRLTGAPPGHVGYGEASPLAIALAANPHRVILFDELEKACSEVHLLLLQILDGARMTTSRGEVLDFSHAIVVLTSNLDIEDARVGFRDARPRETDEARRELLAEHLRPELVARIDEVVQYAPLGHQAALAIAMDHFARSANALVTTGRMQLAALPALRQRVLRDIPMMSLDGGARAAIRFVDRLLAEERSPAPVVTAPVVAYPYLDGGRERLAAGITLEVQSLGDVPEAVDVLLTHPSSGSLLYLVHDRARIVALVGDESAASELADAVARFGSTRLAVGRTRADIAGRPVGELLERLLRPA